MSVERIDRRRIPKYTLQLSPDLGFNISAPTSERGGRKSLDPMEKPGEKRDFPNGKKETSEWEEMEILQRKMLKVGSENPKCVIGCCISHNALSSEFSFVTVISIYFSMSD